jgi:hypothetical protein
MAELELVIKGNLGPLQNDEAMAKRILDGVNEEIKQTERKLRTTVRASFRVVTSLVGTLRSVASMFGIAIPPLFDAILSAVTSTVLAMQAIAAAYAAGGVTAALVIPIEAAAIILSLTSVMVVAMGRQDLEHGLSTSESAIRSMGGTINAVERMLGGF